METPVLNKVQKKLSLSGKKQKKEKIKNVLSNPHRAFWPVVHSEKEQIELALKKNMPCLKQKKTAVPWHILKDVPKEERRDRRNAYLKEKGLLSENIVKERNIVIGVNEVAKCLEENDLSGVLVMEVNPRLLVQHILDMAVLKNIPILVIPDLKSVLNDCCGIKSLAFAIRKNFNESPNLVDIINTIKQVSVNYKPDLNHLNHNRVNKFQYSDNFNNIENSSQIPIQNEDTISKSYHLIRPQSNMRAFIPQTSDTHDKKDIGFISFSNKKISETENNDKSKKINNYKPLKVKRLKGNVNRQKQKIQNLKNKKKRKLSASK